MIICVPEFTSNNLREAECRATAWLQCRAHWESAGYTIAYGEGVSRAAARNLAVARVPADQDVLLFADADTVVPVHQLEAAIEYVRREDTFVLAYTTLYRALRNHQPLPQLLARPQGYRTRDVSNGVVALSRRLWDEVGGFDERFIAWGGEDRAFLFACLTLRDQDEVQRVAGHAVHLWHPPCRDATRPSLAYRANVSLALRYKRAAGIEPRSGPLARLPGATRDRAALEALLREPGGPRSS